MDKKKGKKKKPTSDPRSPYDIFKPEKKEYYRQLPIPGLIYPLAKNNKKNMVTTTKTLVNPNVKKELVTIRKSNKAKFYL